jgi:CelD/BcsL family acetyltransferase involved in cellulose biosynthesis
VHIEVLRPKELSPAMAATWRALQRQGRGWDSPFLSPCWARSVELARGGRGVRVAVVSDGGEPRAFMAATVGQITAAAAGGPMSDYEGFVGDPGPDFDPAALVRALGVSRYDFSHLPADQAAFAPHARGQIVSWIVDLPDGYDAYAAQRRAAGSSALKELDRKRRKAEREAGEIVFTAASTSRADFDRLIELKREQFRRTNQTDVLAVGWTQRLMEGLFSLERPDFGGGLFTLHIGGRLAAVQFNLIGETTIHAWMIAHDAALERYSPGLLLFQNIFRWMDDQPYNRLDLGYGDYRFKTELSNLQTPLIFGFVGTPSPATLLREAAYGVRRAAEALPLGKVSALPGKAMRRLDLIRGLR